MKPTDIHTTASEKLAYTRQELPSIGIRVSDVTLWRLAQRGLLRPVAGVARPRIYARAEIERFLNRKEVA